MQVTLEDSVITVTDGSPVNLNQVSYYSDMYIMVMLLQGHECECSQSTVPLDTIDSGECSKPTVAPDSGDSSDTSDNSKVSVHNCGVFCRQSNQVTVKTLYMDTVPVMPPNAPSDDSDSGADSKVCQFVVCIVLN